MFHLKYRGDTVDDGHFQDAFIYKEIGLYKKIHLNILFHFQYNMQIIKHIFYFYFFIDLYIISLIMELCTEYSVNNCF